MNDLYIMHYGVGHLDGGHSGRYPWGSGDNPRQSDAAFKKTIKSNINRARKTSRKIANFGDRFAIKKDSNKWTSITWGMRRNRNAIREAIKKRYETNIDFRRKVQEAKREWIEVGRENNELARKYIEYCKTQPKRNIIRNLDVNRFIKKTRNIPANQAALDDVEFATKYIFDDNVNKNRAVTVTGAVLVTAAGLKIADTIAGGKTGGHRLSNGFSWPSYIQNIKEAQAMAGADWIGSDWERLNM